MDRLTVGAQCLRPYAVNISKINAISVLKLIVNAKINYLDKSPLDALIAVAKGLSI